jgi:hypothetical protein
MADQGSRIGPLILLAVDIDVEVSDFAVANPKAMFQFGGNGQDHGTERVAGGSDRVGGLFGMASLPVLAAAGAVARLDVELGDDRHDGRQIGLVLHEFSPHTDISLPPRAPFWPSLFIGAISVTPCPDRWKTRNTRDTSITSAR